MVMQRLLVMTVVAAWSIPALGASPFQDLQPSARPHLKSIYSSVHDIQEFTKGQAKGVALVFLGTECPVARQYLPRLNELSEEFRSQGVKILGVYSDVGTNVLDMG